MQNQMNQQVRNMNQKDYEQSMKYIDEFYNKCGGGNMILRDLNQNDESQEVIGEEEEQLVCEDIYENEAIVMKQLSSSNMNSFVPFQNNATKFYQQQQNH